MEKFSFIVYKKSELMYQRLLDSLERVNIPKGFQADVVTIDGCDGIAAAYNEGMKQSNAKYKIYIRESSVVLDPDFLMPILKTFSLDKKIGIVGFSGTKIIPTDAMCINSLYRLGSIYEGEQVEEKKWGDVAGLYEPVQAIDGYCIITRYDVGWRDDIFNKDEYYDIAQCLEFKRHGYKTVVVKQDRPTLYTDKVLACEDEDARNAFLDEYSKDIFPLVSVVIPTYNRPKYLQEALESVLKQTYRNLEIFITDNSHNDKTEKMMERYINNYENIIYEHHDGFEAIDNWSRARSYNNPLAEYVNWLMDDDLFLPDKISKMVNYYLMYPDVSLVTSSRHLIDASGNRLPINAMNKPISDVTVKYDGISAGRAMFTSLNNFIGEPTTALIKKKILKNNDLGWTGKEGRYIISDFSTWMNALAQGNMIYIAEPLSCFRQHDGQDQKNLQTHMNATICWGLELKYAIENKLFLTEENATRMAILRWLEMAVNTLTAVAIDDFHNIDVDNLQMEYIDISRALDVNHKPTFSFDTAMVPTYKKCACCGQAIDRYLPIPDYFKEQLLKYGGKLWRNEMISEKEYICKKCGSADRDRAYALWMERELPNDKKIHILDIAPSKALSSFIRREFPLAQYKTADLFMEDVDYQIDIMDMKLIEDNSIDFFICSHVLEHVRDDIKAMSELRRILKPDGKGILVVPMDLDQDKIDEDPDCNDIAERWRRFGQDDHVRKYSPTGYFARLKSVGFIVNQYKKDYFGKKAMWDNGLIDTTNVYIVSK